ncbi:hypothetical protein bsdE14_39710 [Clostridium omnivorum]|uniref:Uncharacterized protein n=1 Tax=Clostridium omnivorum TaxID=1604902 RepID=A0ABQ5NBK0_9CLOT|nr:hypothetical protein bsdE14_39710 [Clostridium sp. E14]
MPKRFFNAYTDENIKKAVSQHFEIIKYENIDVKKSAVHLQCMILKKKGVYSYYILDKIIK